MFVFEKFKIIKSWYYVYWYKIKFLSIWFVIFLILFLKIKFLKFIGDCNNYEIGERKGLGVVVMF